MAREKSRLRATGTLSDSRSRGLSPRLDGRRKSPTSISLPQTSPNKRNNASDLPKILSLFGCIDPLPSKLRKSLEKKKKKKGEYSTPVPVLQAFMDQVETVLKLLASYQHTSGTRSYAPLFYKYMIESIENESFRNILPSPEMTRIQQILHDYLYVLDHCKPAGENMAQQSLISQAKDFSQYLKEHQLDPFSCLVGIPPAKDVVPHTSSGDSQPPPRASEVDFSNVKQDRDQILQLIMDWALLEDSARVQRRVRQFAGRMRGVAKLPRGSLIVVEIGTSVFRYGRLVEAVEEELVRVSIDPKEIDTFLVSLDAVYPLSEAVKTRIRSLSPLEMEKLVELPTNTVYHELMASSEQLTQKFLHEVDMELLRKANANGCSISELARLKATMQALDRFGKEGPPELKQALDELLGQAVDKFRVHMNSSTAFKPTVRANFKALQEFSLLDSLVVMHVGRYRGICECGLDQLKLQKRSLMSGERKDEISDWWLKEIDREVLNLLKDMGYKYEAIPENYVERPPDDLEAVQENLRVITPFLEGEESSSQRQMIQRLIKTMQDRIYPKIEEFVRDAQIVLSEQFRFDLDGHFDLARVEEAFAREKGSIDPKECGWIEEMIEDIHYLNEMHKLEDPEYAKNNEVSFHIVPVSGLVVGMFTRLQNECKTVCELWEPVDDCGAGNRTSLHRAIVETDTNKVMDILACSPDELRQPDENGFTPVHCAASTYTIPHLEILERILQGSQAEFVPVNGKTIQGNTPLYYLVRFPMENKEEYKDLLLRVMRRLIDLGADVNSKNLVGETSLHSACVLDNAAVVQLLLDHQAAVTETNLEGENCLQIAIKNGNPAVVRTLLRQKEFANASDDKTLVQLARQSPSPQMVQILAGELVQTDEPRTKYRLSMTSPRMRLALDHVQGQGLETESIVRDRSGGGQSGLLTARSHRTTEMQQFLADPRRAPRPQLSAPTPE